MITRRQTTIGLLTAALGSAAATSGAFLSSTAAASDLRVVVVSELTLTPARSDAAEDYVRTDDDGEVEAIEIEKLNRRSITTFAELIDVTNNGDVTYDRLAFEFTPDDDADADAAETLRITSDLDTGIDQQGRTTLLGDDTKTLGPGDAVTFGVVVNLIASSDPGDLEELSESASVTLEISAIDEG